MQAAVAMPLSAIAISAPFPTALIVGQSELMPLTPLRLVLLAGAAVYLHGLWRFQHLLFAWMSAGCVLAAGMGSSVAAIVENMIFLNRQAATSLQTVVPRRDVHWGVLSIGLSFALLLVGWMISLKKLARMQR
jgi:hypothetical protein